MFGGVLPAFTLAPGLVGGFADGDCGDEEENFELKCDIQEFLLCGLFGLLPADFCAFGPEGLVEASASLLALSSLTFAGSGGDEIGDSVVSSFTTALFFVGMGREGSGCDGVSFGGDVTREVLLSCAVQLSDSRILWKKSERVFFLSLSLCGRSRTREPFKE